MTDLLNPHPETHDLRSAYDDQAYLEVSNIITNAVQEYIKKLRENLTPEGKTANKVLTLELNSLALSEEEWRNLLNVNPFQFLEKMPESFRMKLVANGALDVALPRILSDMIQQNRLMYVAEGKKGMILKFDFSYLPEWQKTMFNFYCTEKTTISQNSKFKIF